MDNNDSMADFESTLKRHAQELVTSLEKGR
ncbi:protein phosphatase, partial [Pseudomonas syringae pv. actinidiae]|nr:protein phosphatase [Pseudomonas syringae pv. actinidiae]